MRDGEVGFVVGLAGQVEVEVDADLGAGCVVADPTLPGGGAGLEEADCWGVWGEGWGRVG